MKIFNDSGKVLYNGAFDSSKIDFNDKETVLGEDFRFRYNDKDILNDKMSTALYDFMCSADYLSNDDDLTKLYLCDDQGDGFYLSAFCKPVVFDYEAQNKHEKAIWQQKYNESNDAEMKAWIKKTIKEDKNLNKECAENQRDMLYELEQDGGYAITTFLCELTDAEKQQLKKTMDSMLVRKGM